MSNYFQNRLPPAKATSRKREDCVLEGRPTKQANMRKGPVKKLASWKLARKPRTHRWSCDRSLIKETPRKRARQKRSATCPRATEDLGQGRTRTRNSPNSDASPCQFRQGRDVGHAWARLRDDLQRCSSPQHARQAAVCWAESCHGPSARCAA